MICTRSWGSTNLSSSWRKASARSTSASACGRSCTRGPCPFTLGLSMSTIGCQIRTHSYTSPNSKQRKLWLNIWQYFTRCQFHQHLTSSFSKFVLFRQKEKFRKGSTLNVGEIGHRTQRNIQRICNINQRITTTISLSSPTNIWKTSTWTTNISSILSVSSVKGCPRMRRSWRSGSRVTLITPTIWDSNVLHPRPFNPVWLDWIQREIKASGKENGLDPNTNLRWSQL